MIYIIIGASVILLISAVLLLTTLLKGNKSDNGTKNTDENIQLVPPVTTATDVREITNDIMKVVGVQDTETDPETSLTDICVEEWIKEGVNSAVYVEDKTNGLNIEAPFEDVIEYVEPSVESAYEDITESAEYEFTEPETAEAEPAEAEFPESYDEIILSSLVEPAAFAEETAAEGKTDVSGDIEYSTGEYEEERVSVEIATVHDEKKAEVEDISSEILEALEKLSFEADDLRQKTLHLAERTLSLNKEKLLLAEEKEMLAEEKNQLAEEKLQLAEEKAQLAVENETMKKEADALESLLQEKYIRIGELEDIIAGPDTGEEQPVYDVRTAIRDILPDLQAMANEAMVDFSLKIGEIRTPFAIFDRNLVNNMILRMVFSGLRYSNPGGGLVFSISQIEIASKNYAEYMYTCVYLGEQVDFYSEEAAALGGVVDIQRTTDGGVAISVRVRFRIDQPDFSYLNIKSAEESEAQ